MSGERERWFPGTLIGQLELLVKVGLIAGGCVAVVQYFEAREEQRVARTLEFVERFESERMVQSRQVLLDAFRSLAPLAARLEELELNPDAAAQAEAAIVEFLQTEANGTGVSQEIDTVVGFFDGLEACLRSGLCDQRTATDFFGHYARDLTGNLRPYVNFWRERRSERYAAGLIAVSGLDAPGASQ